MLMCFSQIEVNVTGQLEGADNRLVEVEKTASLLREQSEIQTKTISELQDDVRYQK